MTSFLQAGKTIVQHPPINVIAESAFKMVRNSAHLWKKKKFEIDAETLRILAKKTFPFRDWFPNVLLLNTYLLTWSDGIGGY